jgi:hypothetical protein
MSQPHRFTIFPEPIESEMDSFSPRNAKELAAGTAPGMKAGKKKKDQKSEEDFQLE